MSLQGLKTEKNLIVEITKFTIPLILTNVLQQMYNIIDHMIAGNYAGEMTLAAIGATSHVLGTSTCVEKKRQKQVVMATLALIIIGILTTVICVFIF